LICTQEQAPLHGWVALQRPLQTPIRPALLCSCRAETVPAKRTAVTIAASNVGVTLLLMIALLSVPQPQFFCGCGLSGPGSLTQALTVPKSWQMHPPRHGLVALQVPVQAGNTLGFVCSCRAETLPAHKTAVIKIASDAFLMAFMLMVISFLDRKN